jgi:hypothetical protein
MGCFSVSCCLSNLPIYSQRIGIMLLNLDLYCKKEFPFDKNFICSNEGSGVFFKPASPIIWGECDTYGNIEDITIDEGFIWTCKEVLKIEPTEEAFREWFGSDWMGNPSDGTYITFFLEDVVKQAIEFSREQNSAYNYYCQHWVLEKFPQFFKLEETFDKNKERYNLIYSIVGSDKRIASDERWIHDVNNKHEGFYKTKDLLKWIDIPEITETIMSTEVGTMYDIILQEQYNRARIMARISGGITFSQETTFPEELHQSNVDIMLLGSYMFQVNRYYAPVFSGPQHNEYDAIKHLLKLSTDIVEKELAQGDDD